jgi:lipopolysaccharide transport system ATP-binding protein
MGPTVEFDGVWKKFRKGEWHDSLRDLLPSLVRRSFSRTTPADLQDSEFWAVRGVSFTVEPGEALGIIGSNGAGKSTILKLLTKILRPTRGQCAVRGRIGALIEIAAGFHPDLTGRENVFLQGAIMGMKQADIARKFDQIVDFGGVADFIDTPVKRYSSGMNARLGFAIAAHLDPEVLLIDEVLSVGDASFQDRCVSRMRELVRSGIPLVFISHNLPSIIDLCTRTIVLERGCVTFDGTPADAIAHYRMVSSAAQAEHEDNSAAVRLNRVLLLDGTEQPALVFRTDAEMTFRIEFDAREPVEATVHVDIHRTDGVHCAGFNNFMDQQSFGTLSGPGTLDIRIPRLPLLPGCYTASVWILDGHAIQVHQKRLFAYPFSVVSEQHGIGMMHVPRRWTVLASDVAPAETAQAR